MKKLGLSGLLILFLVMLTTTDLKADEKNWTHSKSYLTLNCFDSPKGVGLKQHLFRNIYFSGNMDYLPSVRDLEFQLGATYVIPRKILIFRFYGGAGFQLSRNVGYDYPYVVLGTNFLFFFSEVIHPLRPNLLAKYRFGLSFKI